MQFTGRNLQMVRTGIDLALAELHNRIATCPDVVEYASDIEQYEAEQEEFNRLLTRIDRAIARETNAPNT